MIAKLTGIVDSLGPDWAVIDVGGVGYLVQASARTLSALPQVGGQVALVIETHVREDHIHLYGFADGAERDWFRLLTTVQGVGSKVALGLLGALAAETLTQAIAAGDAATLTRAPGVGAKLAGRIIAVLKDRVAALAMPLPVRRASGFAAQGPSEDAVSALVHLGYRRAEAFGAVAQAVRRLGADAPVEEVIRAGLRELGG